MKEEDYDKMSEKDKLDYWLGRLILAIGKGEIREEIYLMTDVYRRKAYAQGYEQGKKDASKS